MEIINGQNPNKVKYFSLSDYVSNIKVNSDVLLHMEETNIEFDKYMNKLKKYCSDDVLHFWLTETANELVSSNQIEKHYVDRREYLKKNLFFDTLSINHKRIHTLHNFVLDKNTPLAYRTVPIRVSCIDKTGKEIVYWHGPDFEDVPSFMNDFISIYKSMDLSVINSNPFLKSSLIQLLFIRIHPYQDGNGRTARLLYNIKFTEAINKIYGMKLKLCPLNISASILINQFQYVKILDNIYFDLEHDNNEWINKWFDFILNMADEQLFYISSKIDTLDDVYKKYLSNDDKFKRMLQGILHDINNLDENNDTLKQLQKTTADDTSLLLGVKTKTKETNHF